MEYLDTREAAKLVRLSPRTLERLRTTGAGPAFSKAGSKIVIYSRLDIETWLSQRRVTSTAEADAA